MCLCIERLKGRSVVCRFQQAQGGEYHGPLLLTLIRQPQGTAREMRCDEGACWFEQFRIRAKRFDVHAHRWDADQLDSARDVTHGHMTDRSAWGQEDGIHAILLEHLRPLRRALLHQPGNVSQPVIGVVALRQSADHSLLR